MKILSPYGFSWAFCAAFLTALANPAHSAVYAVSGSISYYDPGILVIAQYDSGGPESIGREVHHDAPGIQDFHAQANSLAEPYGLHAHAYNEIIHQVSGEPGGGTYVSTAFAKAAFTDFIITGPPGGPDTVQTAVNFHLAGTMGLTYYIPTPGNGSGVSTSIYFSMQINGGDNDGGGYALQYRNGIPSPANATDMLVGFNGDQNLKTRIFTLPVNMPIPLAIFLTASSQVSVNFDDSFRTAANTDFEGTLTFAVDRPVFDLPQGYTVNSAEAHILDNAFTSPTHAKGGAGPVGFALEQPSPNPSAGITRIGFSLPQPGPVRVEVYDRSGRRVWSVVESLSSGRHALLWDGRTSEGRRADGGLYFVRLATPSGTRSERLLRLR